MPHINKSAVLWKEVDGLVVILLIANGNFIELNRTGSFIWKQIAEGAAVNEIVEKMSRTFDAPKEKLSTDVREFVARVISRGLVNE